MNHKDYVGSYTAIIDALEKENHKLMQENKDLKEQAEYCIKYIDKYHELITRYQGLVTQYKNRLSVAMEMLEMEKVKASIEGVLIEVREIL